MIHFLAQGTLIALTWVAVFVGLGPLLRFASMDVGDFLMGMVGVVLLLALLVFFLEQRKKK